MPISLDLILALSFFLIWALVADIKLCDLRRRRIPGDENMVEELK